MQRWIKLAYAFFERLILRRLNLFSHVLIWTAHGRLYLWKTLCKVTVFSVSESRWEEGRGVLPCHRLFDMRRAFLYRLLQFFLPVLILKTTIEVVSMFLDRDYRVAKRYIFWLEKIIIEDRFSRCTGLSFFSKKNWPRAISICVMHKLFFRVDRSSEHLVFGVLYRRYRILLLFW